LASPFGKKEEWGYFVLERIFPLKLNIIGAIVSRTKLPNSFDVFQQRHVF
jgi:hypothetical protein